MRPIHRARPLLSVDDWPWILSLCLLAVGTLVDASTGMPWEKPLDMVAGSLTGKAGVSAATIAVAWSGVNYRLGHEHGKEVFIATSMGVGLILGAASLVQLIGGGAGGSPLVPQAGLPWGAFLSDALGELLGYGVYMSWLVTAVWVWPWRHTDAA